MKRSCFVILSFFIFIVACTSIDCPVKNMVCTNYALMKADGTTDTLGTDTIWIWTIRADGKDTLLNCLYGDITSFSLPISHTQPEDILVMFLADTTETYYLDTIRIKKENIPRFESVDCQATYFHEITNVSTTHRAIDSISIHHSYVNYDTENDHFYLYLKAER